MQVYAGTYIGLLFTVVSFLGSWSFVLPLLTIVPVSVTFEAFYTGIFGEYSYPTVGKSVLITLAVCFISLCILYFRHVFKQSEFNKRRFILFLVLVSFFIHPLGFYLDLSADWSRASDGQIFFSISDQYYKTSMSYLCLGALIDLTRYVRLR